mmetsp:Transcript_13392/g.38232  ORF Transcript_13392/g.38232 Transcript_13392/m.38232 type:complete len:240 (-) Transcript_13392:367-1086(-)
MRRHDHVGQLRLDEAHADRPLQTGEGGGVDVDVSAALGHADDSRGSVTVVAVACTGVGGQDKAKTAGQDGLDARTSPRYVKEYGRVGGCQGFGDGRQVGEEVGHHGLTRGDGDGGLVGHAEAIAPQRPEGRRLLRRRQGQVGPVLVALFPHPPTERLEESPASVLGLPSIAGGDRRASAAADGAAAPSATGRASAPIVNLHRCQQKYNGHRRQGRPHLVGSGVMQPGACRFGTGDGAHD